VERLRTSVGALDALTDGGLPTGTVTQIFGEKALGKSIMSLQAAFATAATGRSAVIVDTEQSYQSYLLPYWKEALSKRFEKEVVVVDAKIVREAKGSRKKPVSRSQLVTALSTSLAQAGVSYLESQLSQMVDVLSPEVRVEMEERSGGRVILLQVPEIIDLLALHGVDGFIGVSEGGRVELHQRRAPVYPSPLHYIVKEADVKLIVYDSISAPLKSVFTGTADLPARSSSLAMVLMNAQRLCIEFDLAVLATSHVTINPIQGWDRRPFGGVILGHEAKFSFELTKNGASRGRDSGAVAVNPDEQSEGSRLIWVQRHPAMADYSKYGYFAITGDGIH
jgi:hypothetical protein